MVHTRSCMLAVVALISWTGRAAAVVALRAESVTVNQPGASADICVGLETGGEMVAGTQNDLVWDGNCATLPRSGACQVNPATGKQLQGGFPPQFDFTFRALVLSLSDVGPIPDGQLYCCSFRAEGAPGSCCPIAIVRAAASDPKGNALGVNGNTAQLCVSDGSGTPVPTATLGPGGDDGDGCQVGGSKARAAGAGWLALPAIVVVMSRRRRSRARAAT